MHEKSMVHSKEAERVHYLELREYECLTVEEALALMTELSDDDTFHGADIFLDPPSNEVTDEDSGKEDCLEMNNLTGGQLRAKAVVTLRKNNQERKIIGESDSEVEDVRHTPSNCKKRIMKKKIPQKNRNWSKSELRKDNYLQLTWNEQKPPFLNVHWSPTSLFELFLNGEIIQLILEQSILYAGQKGDHDFVIDADELKLFFAILLTSGYNVLPRRRMYWENSSDVRNNVISEAMPRCRFEKIMQYLHFADNSNLDKTDKMAKLRPFFNLLNETFLRHMPDEQQLSIDESMVPYFGHHGCKQYIKGKPIRYGYKVWCLNTKLDYLIQFEPYRGAGTVSNTSGIGMGGAVVMDLISELPENKQYDLYFDNLFTSPALIDKLTEKRMGATGTVRKNRIENCPLEEIKSFKKRKRGSYDFRNAKNLSLVRWNDNSVVTLASNQYGVTPIVQAKRWSNAERKFIEIDQPFVVSQYNKFMGGTDRMDQNIAQYRCSIRSKKWWWPLFLFGLEAPVQNAWLLYRLCPSYEDKKMDLLQFRREICQTYFAKYSKRANISVALGKPKKLSSRVCNEVSFDGKDHLIVVNPKQIRCAYCGKKSTRKCIKCLVGLHDKCFEIFHTE
ncbi:piggyBac transposable element-derived protein 3-like [Uloborus diversus]|uniref:piggyBac transposable element-derived protein 3-like n=1 Tax=Uloborus diversus TaxID=327109 RepID=UPI00240A2EC9|nr:piggyBac transposable element-derived protein 3-like [Uloborus diversus]